MLAALGLHYYAIPLWTGSSVRLRPVAMVLLAIIIAVVQLGRRTAKRLSAGTLPRRVGRGFLRRTRTIWRRLSWRVFGLDLPREEIEGLATIHFRAQRGMVGILGPNGAGKTTLLRLLAGILEPTLGNVLLGGVSIKSIRRHLARWVGYLPQDFGLPNDLTGREYLDYYALLYDIGAGAERRERVNLLLEEVGLSEHADKRIGSYSGGMRQRVAVVEHPPVEQPPAVSIPLRSVLPAQGREPMAPESQAPSFPPSPPLRSEGQESRPADDDSDFARQRRRGWAKLISKVWLEDPSLCASCGQPMKIISVITSPDQDDVIERILRHLHLWDPPWKRQRRARGPPTPPEPAPSPAPDRTIDPLIDDELYAIDPLPPDDFSV